MSHMDRDLRVLILKYICKFEDFKKSLAAEQASTLTIQPQNYAKLVMPHGNFGGDPVYQSCQKLLAVEVSHKAMIVNAVEYAIRTAIPKDLVKPILQSCKNGKQYTYDYFATRGKVFCSRSTFYRCKNLFLEAIQIRLGLD